MQAFLSLLAVSLLLAPSAPETRPVNWSAWRGLPVQHGGRIKPLDTLSWEAMRLVANRVKLTDPQTGAAQDATAAYLTMVFDWSGWNNPKHDQMMLVSDWRRLYFALHQPDKWDQAAIIRVDHLQLRAALGMNADQTHLSPWQLTQALVEDTTTGKTILFTALADQLLEKEGQNKKLSKYEEKVLELANKLWSYQNLRMGRDLEVLPVAGTKGWMPVAHLLLTNFDATNDPTGQYRQAQGLLRKMRASYQAGDTAEFESHAQAWLTLVRDAQVNWDAAVRPTRVDLEVTYNQWAPFRIGWVAMLTSFLLMLLHFGTRWSPLRWGSFLSYGVALTAVIAGFTMRILISGRPPVTNMYESVVYVSLGVAVFGLILEAIYRVNYIVLAASAVSTVGLILCDNSPTILDPSLQPLEPVLRSNFWLVTHVMTITLSYAAFALALGISNITLGYFFVRSQNQKLIRALNQFTYKALQIGVLLLAAGTILGGVWADYSWGRFWGWDPKEVWALVALLGYLAVLHARYAGLVGQRGLPSLAVCCFVLVVMAWYGVNFVLGAGLHSYGFGDGGQPWVYTCIVLQLAYMGMALYRSRLDVESVEAAPARKPDPAGAGSTLGLERAPVLRPSQGMA